MIAGPGGLRETGRFLATPTGKALLAAMVTGALLGCSVSVWAGHGIFSWISYGIGLVMAGAAALARYAWLTRVSRLLDIPREP